MLSILAHFSSHFSQRVQATGACPWTDRHSQQKKWPFPQSTVCEILIMSLAVVDLSGTKLTSLAQPRHKTRKLKVSWWNLNDAFNFARTTDTQWRYNPKISEKLCRYGRQNMLWPYLKIWYWEWIFGHAVKSVVKSNFASKLVTHVITLLK